MQREKLYDSQKIAFLIAKRFGFKIDETLSDQTSMVWENIIRKKQFFLFNVFFITSADGRAFHAASFCVFCCLQTPYQKIEK